MSADIAALLALRNARFRAWQAVGVPVVGEGWVPERVTIEPGRVVTIYRLLSRCGVCGRSGGIALWPRHPDDPHDGHEDPVYRERQMLDCPHLAPLLGDDPPEVLALTQLELLAGEGAG